MVMSRDVTATYHVITKIGEKIILGAKSSFKLRDGWIVNNELFNVHLVSNSRNVWHNWWNLLRCRADLVWLLIHKNSNYQINKDIIKLINLEAKFELVIP